jgi:catalase
LHPERLPANPAQETLMTKKVTKGSEAPLETKIQQLDPYRNDPDGQVLTTDQGVPIPHTDDTLRAGERGPALLEDFHFREKMTRFDHERIPERVVHARGSAAHGHFRVYESLADLTSADFLNDPSIETPVFVRFSTVQGSRGSADTVRDVRGFATKFYTRKGNFDLVGNNMPVFFVQDGIKFPDFVHAVKPEPHHEMPQGASAHDSLWDFVSLVPETAHMIMWAMSDRALPRSYRMMEGFGVHTFKLVNARGEVKLCKFHWKPLLGAHSLVWDEAQKISGKDPDFHRRDLWDSINDGYFPEWELGVQVVDEKDELAFGFDLLDVTKLLPEEVVPVRRVGRMRLDRNPDNFFAETEQVAFCVSNIVPGIDFTDDPMMQARLFSYLDTQLTRLGGPNFAEIPINRPIAPVHNHQQDGFHRTTIPTGVANYHPNSIGLGCPHLAKMSEGFVPTPQPVAGNKVRQRSATFKDHFTQAKMFLASQSPPEREHMVKAFQFELGKVERPAIRERVLRMFANVDVELVRQVAEGLGVTVELTPTAPAEKPKAEKPLPAASPALSLLNQPRTSVQGRKVAVLATDGARRDELEAFKVGLAKAGAIAEIIAHHGGSLRTADGEMMAVDKSLLTVHSVLYDAVYVAGGADSVKTLLAIPEAQEFVRDAYRHAKVVGATAEGLELLASCQLPGIKGGPSVTGVASERGVVTAPAGQAEAFPAVFIEALKQHRFFER